MKQPLDYYQQHHALDAPKIDADSFRPFWRRRTHLDQLLIDRAIGIRQHRAGQRFRALAETAMSGAYRTQSLDRGGSDRGDNLSNGVAIAAHLDALARLATIRAALGPFAFVLLEVHLVRDLNWRAIAARYHVTPRTARAWVIVALHGLADLLRTGGIT